MGPGLHQAGAVASHDRTRLGLEHNRRKRRGAYSPTDKEPSLVTHLSCCERTLRPAKALGTSRVALAQSLRGERLARDRLDFGVVLQAECQWVRPAGLSRFVDRALQRNRSRCLAGGSHEHRRAGVNPDHLVRCGDGRARVKRVRGVGSRLEEIVEGARCRLRVMADCGQPAVAVSTDAERLPGGRAMTYRTIHLFAAQHELDRPADQSGRHDAEDLRPEDQALGAEAAAQEGAANMDFFRRDAEEFPRSAPGPWRGPDLGVSMDKKSPSHAATIAWGSMGL